MGPHPLGPVGPRATCAAPGPPAPPTRDPFARSRGAQNPTDPETRLYLLRGEQNGKNGKMLSGRRKRAIARISLGAMQFDATIKLAVEQATKRLIERACTGRRHQSHT